MAAPPDARRPKPQGQIQEIEPHKPEIEPHILNGPFTDEDAALHHYHATSLGRAQEIVDAGHLRPHGPSYGTDQLTWPDGSRAKRIYFGKPSTIDAFAPIEGKPVALRIKRSAAAFKQEQYTGDIYASHKIPADKLELKTNKGWSSLKEFMEPSIESTIRKSLSK